MCCVSSYSQQKSPIDVGDMVTFRPPPPLVVLLTTIKHLFCPSPTTELKVKVKSNY